MAHFTKFLWIIALAGVAVVINMVRYPAVSESLFSGMEVSVDPSVDETDNPFVMEPTSDTPETDRTLARRGSMDAYAEDTAEIESQTPQTFSDDEIRLAEGGLLSPLPDSRKWVRPIPVPPALYSEMLAFQGESRTPIESAYATNYPSSAPLREAYESPSRTADESEEEGDEGEGYVSSPRPFMSPRDSSTDEQPWNAPPDFERLSGTEDRAEPRSVITNPQSNLRSEYALQDDSPFPANRMTTLPENIDEDPDFDEPDSLPFEDELERLADEDSHRETSDDEYRSAMVAESPSNAGEEQTAPEPNTRGAGEALAAGETQTADATPPAAPGSHWDWSSPSNRTPSVDRTASDRSTTGRQSYPDPAVASLEASREPAPSGPPLSHYGRPTNTIPASTPPTSMEPTQNETPSEYDARPGSSSEETNSWVPRRPATIEGVSAPLQTSRHLPEIRPLPPVMGG